MHRLTEVVRPMLAGVLACLLAACAPSPLTEQIQQAGEQAGETLDAHLDGQARRLLVQHHEGPYLDARRITYEGTAWLHEWVDMRVSQLPMNMVLAKAMDQLAHPPSVVFTADLEHPELPVTLAHHGTFRSFLDQLAEASGYGWEQRNGTLYWMAEITRQYDIHRVPGDVSFSMEIEEPGSALESGGSGSVDAATEGGGEISLDGGGTFWDDLEAAINALSSDAVKHTLDRSTGTVVVRGPAAQVRRIGHYIRALNRWLERQVLLEIQVVQVALNDERQLGIDWNLVRDATEEAHRVVNFTGGFGSVGGAVLTGRFGGRSGSIFNNVDTKIVISALQDQGQTSIEKSPRIVSMNGQAAQLKVLDDQTVIASRSTTTTGTVGTTQASIEPGTVSTGITVTILPKIVGRQVLLQANIQVSNLVNIMSSGGEEEISLPHVQRNQFFQSARLSSGETLALGGLISQEGRDAGRNVPGVKLLGQTTKKFSRIETVLLITPTLLDPPSPDEALLQ